MGDDLPRKAFRVMYFDGEPTVVERTLVGRSGSWFTTRDAGGNEHRENGNRWSDTVREALAIEAWHLMNRYAMQRAFKPCVQVRHMQALLDESFRWGELLGAVNGLRREPAELDPPAPEQVH